MKKYDGPNTWHETLYFYRLDEDDIEWKKEWNEYGQDMKPGDTEFYLPAPPFGASYDKNSVSSFDIYLSGFIDENLLIFETEEYNWFKRHRI